MRAALAAERLVHLPKTVKAGAYSAGPPPGAKAGS